MAPILIGVVTLAAYETNYAVGDLVVVIAFGMLGVFMKFYGWPRPPILMALVLSKIVEKYLWLSINTYGLSMLLRPQFLAIIVAVGIVIFISMRLQASAKSASTLEAKALPMRDALREFGEDAARRRMKLDLAGEVALLIVVGSFFTYLFVGSLSWSFGAALMPRLTVALGAPFLIIRVAALLRRTEPRQVRGKIMDTGFHLGADPKAEGERFLRICLFILGLSIWRFGSSASTWRCRWVSFYIFFSMAGPAGSVPAWWPHSSLG